MADNDATLKEWIDSLTLSEDERKIFDSILKDEKRGKTLKDSVLMRSDHSRKMNELQQKEQALQAEIQKKEQELATQHASLVNWKGTADKTLQQLQKERDEAVTKLAGVQTKVKTLAENYGIDPKEVIGEPEPAPTAQPRGEDGRFVAKEDFDKAVKDVMQFPEVSAELIDISAEHSELFGKPLKGVRELVHQAIKANRTIKDQWEDQFKVAERRVELARLEKETEEKRIRDDERTKVLSEVKIPVPRSVQPIGPALSMLPKPSERPTETEASERAVAAALDAYNTGKYRQTQQ